VTSGILSLPPSLYILYVKKNVILFLLRDCEAKN